MKITLKELKQLIKEEIKRVALQEQQSGRAHIRISFNRPPPGSSSGTVRGMQEALNRAVNGMTFSNIRYTGPAELEATLTYSGNVPLQIGLGNIKTAYNSESGSSYQIVSIQVIG